MKITTLHKFFAGAILLSCVSGAVLAQSTISTICGSTYGSSGDGGAAVSALLATPSGVAVDGSGNIFIADKYNARIRKIDAVTGNISTYASSSYSPGGSTIPIMQPVSVFVDATGEVLFTDHFRDMSMYVDVTTGNVMARCGCGSQGNTGDGGPCTMAKMMIPASSCEDVMGNTYIADYGSNRIRRVDALTGIVTTVAGTGVHGYSGDGGPAVDAQFSSLTGVFVDPTSPGLGHLYISDGGNNVIRMVDLNTGIIRTVIGNGTAGYTGNYVFANLAQLRNPGAIFVDGNKNLYFCDRGNNVIRKVMLGRNIIYTVVGNGTAGFSGDGAFPTYAQLNDPEGIWVDNSGRMYIADAANNRIRMVTPGVMPETGAPISFTPKTGTVSSAVDADAISIYPNPSAGIFNLAIGTDHVGAQVVVTDMLGRKVLSASAESLNGVIDLSGQPAGVYYAVVSSATGGSTIKIVKQ